MIKLYTQLLEEMTARFGGHKRSSEEPAILSSRTPRTKEEEYDLLKVITARETQVTITKLQYRRNKFTMYVCNHDVNNNLSYRDGMTWRAEIIVK